MDSNEWNPALGGDEGVLPPFVETMVTAGYVPSQEEVDAALEDARVMAENMRAYGTIDAPAPTKLALGGEPEVIAYRAGMYLGFQPGHASHADMAMGVECKALVYQDDHRAHVARLQAEVERLNADLDLYKEGKEKLLFWCREARGETTKLRSALAAHQSAAARTAELEGLLHMVRENGGAMEDHEWERIDAALAGGKEHE